MTRLDLSPEVAESAASGKPILALESTIISHGMPYPENIQTALRLEDLAREEGVTPATIAVLKGRMKVGLGPDEIERLADSDVVKASRRDLPLLAATGKDGATTVAATMFLASLAGIEVFATGGIGGVHRGAGTSFDISADLEQLTRSKVAVVCAGVKSILDIGLTLEYLETKGVPVLGFQTNRMPAFYARRSGYDVDRLDSPEQCAKVMAAQWDLNLGGGLVVVNPVPEDMAMEERVMEDAIGRAIAEAEGVRGKDITPFLLKRMTELTGGDCLKSNIALVENNVRLGAHIARAYVSNRR